MVEIRAAERPVPPPSIKTPVLQLASGGLVSKMEALDQSELHTVDKWGGALHYAVSNDHAAAARWLLERGVAVDHKNDDGRTALSNAIRRGNAGCSISSNTTHIFTWNLQRANIPKDTNTI